jgi:TetR/AcrR family transcriptional repressor of lmrAB and yxaGH operons
MAKRAPVREAAPTTKGERSRGKLVRAAAELFRKQGYHATGLAEIVSASGAPRGSLYFYFPGGKEELACAAIEDASAEWRERIERLVDDAESPSRAIAVVCDELAKTLEASGWEHGCPVATVALEASAGSESVRQGCVAHFARWEDAIALRLQEAGVPEADAKAIALFVLATLEGALLLAKVERSTRPLVVASRMLERLVTA